MRRIGHVRLRVLLAMVPIAIFPIPALGAQGAAWVRANFTKYEYRIPMRDGKKLFTSVFVPKDHTERRPILLNRTPYSVQPYGVDRSRDNLGPSDLFKDGYIYVYQDVRGRWMSEGEFVDMRPIQAHHERPEDFDESTDARDTIEWLLKHVEGHNGKVGMWGISYPGFYTAAALVDAHPALVAASPQAPVVDWFVGDDWHHNGAFFLPHAFNFLIKFGHPRPEPTKKFDHPFDHGTPDGYDFFLRMGPLPAAETKYFKGEVAFWKELMRHGTYDDFWKARNLRPHLKSIRSAVLAVGGWFDAENVFGPLATYRTIEASTPGASNRLVMGPWYHGGWARDPGEGLGPVRFNTKTSSFYAEQIEHPFFEYHLRGKGKPDFPEAWVFTTGKNEWQKHAAWPPAQAKAKSLYLRSGGKLSFDAPDAPGSSSDDAHDEYVSDPAKPVPFIGEITIEMKREYMIADQRFASRRPDVLTYQTEPLEDDVTLVGPIRPRLHVSTSGTDSDWIVKLIDVYPDDYPDTDANPSGVRMGGYQQLVRGDIIRGKFRNSLESPEPFVPDRPTEVNFTLPDISHTFRPGHRIMVQVQSSWFPLVDRNPQKFVDIYSARESDFEKATQKVYRSSEKASRLDVMVLP